MGTSKGWSLLQVSYPWLARHDETAADGTGFCYLSSTSYSLQAMSACLAVGLASWLAEWLPGWLAGWLQ